MLSSLSAIGQSTTKEVYDGLMGSWVKTKAYWADDERKEALPDYHQAYLKYEWTKSKQLLVYGSYMANGVSVNHELKGRNLSFQFGRHFIIERIDGQKLVMAELVGGPSGRKGIRFEFMREQQYIDSLPVSPKDYILKAEGDTLYFDSEKFHPRFTNKQDPDFHLYVHNQIRRYYPDGENYFYASFEIDGNGRIGSIQVFASPNEKSANKAVEAIKRSEGEWKLPKLNGRGVSVSMCIEDRYNKGRRAPGINQNDITQRFSEAFVRAHQNAVNNYLKKQYGQMPEWLDWCEKMKPNEPTFLYIKYLYSQAVNDAKAADKYQNRISQTPLNFLVN